MRNTKYTVKPTAQFKKDYKLAIKRGLKISLLEDIITVLAMGESLPDKNKDHAPGHTVICSVNKLPPYGFCFPSGKLLSGETRQIHATLLSDEFNFLV